MRCSRNPPERDRESWSRLEWLLVSDLYSADLRERKEEAAGSIRFVALFGVFREYWPVISIKELG